MSYYYGYYPPSKPRAVKGGIRASSKRAGFGENWWARRWIKTLEDFDMGARLDRGKSYARKGQVMDIKIGQGMVSALVQGSMRQPYEVSIKIKTVGERQWRKLAAALSGRPILAAKLLAGEMPNNIEAIFEDVGLSLFPETSDDIETECDCPDWSNPCKHIAAVYLLLGEEFDRNPFLVFRMRGIEREEFLELAGMQHAAPKPGRARREPAKLVSDPDKFWGYESQLDSGTAAVPAVPAALPKQLGDFPFWRGEEGFMPAMEEIYGIASKVGLDVFLGERCKREE